ncbi:hypothetical protein LWI28_013441 [Acer negundo]|uniref:DUF295 domain-containing protein n=1 Tax=Acer negundo TaxID=4023 RepID=A0AAD5J5A4_ACENE|nr:hypothetical protein LWI28_013441 [Acer negundo]KAK4851290.1 hypothetical protein QYF36_013884 [Acer negundo]
MDITRVKQHKEDQVRDWATLPGGVVGKIADNLSLYDYLCFSNVCKTWRSYQEETITLHRNQRSPGFPWLVMSMETEAQTLSCISLLEKNKLWQFEMPSSSGELCWGCIEDWLFIVKHINDFFLMRISLLNPFTGSEVVLPIKDMVNSKLVFSGDPGKQNCVYMLLCYIGSTFDVWIPEAKHWCQCGPEEVTDDLIDLICFKGSFYLLTNEYNIRVLDATHAYSTIQTQGYKKQIDTRFHKIEMSSDIPRENTPCIDIQIFRYMVEFGDGILLIVRFLKDNFKETYDFKVFRLDMSKKEWVKLDSLGDCVIFLGRNCSRCYSTKELGGDMGNCIYFTNGSGFRSWMVDDIKRYCSIEKDDWGVFRLNSDGSERFSQPPVWLTAPLWWYFNKFRP